MKFLNDLFTEADNATFDMKRLLWAVGVVTGLGFQGYAIFKGQTFSIQDFGIGLGAMLAAGGAALSMNAKSETT